MNNTAETGSKDEFEEIGFTEMNNTVKKMIYTFILISSCESIAADIEFSFLEIKAPSCETQSNLLNLDEKFKTKVPIDNKGQFNKSFKALSKSITVKGNLKPDPDIHGQFLTDLSVDFFSDSGSSNLNTELVLTNNEPVIVGRAATCIKGKKGESRNTVMSIKLVSDS